MNWNFDNTYSRLPENFYTKQLPIPVRNPSLVLFNYPLAVELGLINSTTETDAINVATLAGNNLPTGAEPLAQAYAGHQFGHFTMLGDGRAILLGEHITPTKQRVDVQLKGSGITPFSRRGDGRAALGPMLREYIISEAMYALSIPTTRSLAVVTTGESILRDTWLPGAILTRIAQSHIRVGTFEYFAAQGDNSNLRLLADYTIHRHYPELITNDNKYLALCHAVLERQAELIAKWLLVGFIHGVMNTDNMTLSGETIDYGPCAFMDQYHPSTVFSSIDIHSRYAYAAQPNIAQWNLARFIETIFPFLHEKKDNALKLAQEAIESFSELFQLYWLRGMRSKLGLFNTETSDAKLVMDLLEWMQHQQADYTATFRALSWEKLPKEAIGNDNFYVWQQCWQARLSRQSESKLMALQLMRANNPVIIPRNHLVEAALNAAVKQDMSLIQDLLIALSKPYIDIPEYARYSFPPEKIDELYQTFCGT